MTRTWIVSLVAVLFVAGAAWAQNFDVTCGNTQTTSGGQNGALALQLNCTLTPQTPPVNAPIATFFHDTGDLTDYTSISFGGNDFSVTQPGLSGTSHALKIEITNQAVVTATYGEVATSQLDQPVIAVEGDFDVTNLQMAAGDREIILVRLKHDGGENFQLRLYKANGKLWYYTQGWQDLGFNNWKATSTWPVTDGPHHVKVMIQRATSATAEDGFICLWIDGELLEVVNGLDLFERPFPDTIQVGIPGSLDAQTIGSIVMDQIEVYNTFQGE